MADQVCTELPDLVTGLFQAVDTVNDFVNEAVKVMYEKDEAR